MTWDVDSHDAALCARLSRFVFGYGIMKNGKAYRYPGFVEREGVRYLGQSVLFVTSDTLSEIDDFLHTQGIDHVVLGAKLESIMRSCAENGGTPPPKKIMNSCAEIPGMT